MGIWNSKCRIIVNIASISGNGNNLLNKSSYELRNRIADLDKGRLSIHSLFSNNNYIDSTAFSFDYFANKKQNFILIKTTLFLF